MTAPAKPLLYLVRAEERLKPTEPRNLNVDPFMLGEGPKFFTPARVAALAADNAAYRKSKGR